jgi:ABC-type multidrug transport system permease subunit
VSATPSTVGAGAGEPTLPRSSAPHDDGAPSPRSASRLRWAVHDSLVLTERNLRIATRIPELLVLSTIQPVMFVLLFRYVFGGAIHVGGGVSYIDFLMAGIFVQTVAFGGMSTGVGLAHDLESGLIDRYRSLPMSHLAVVLGRTSADLVRNAFTVLVMLAVGLAVGFRPHGSVAHCLAACVGLAVRNIEAVQSAGFIWLLPLTFASSAFVPTSTMPDGVRQFAEVQPLSKIVDAVRALFLNHPVHSNVWVATAWCVGIIAVFMPLAVRLFRRAAGKA